MKYLEYCLYSPSFDKYFYIASYVSKLISPSDVRNCYSNTTKSVIENQLSIILGGDWKLLEDNEKKPIPPDIQIVPISISYCRKR